MHPEFSANERKQNQDHVGFDTVDCGCSNKISRYQSNLLKEARMFLDLHVTTGILISYRNVTQIIFLFYRILLQCPSHDICLPRILE